LLSLDPILEMVTVHLLVRFRTRLFVGRPWIDFAKIEDKRLFVWPRTVQIEAMPAPWEKTLWDPTLFKGWRDRVKEKNAF